MNRYRNKTITSKESFVFLVPSFSKKSATGDGTFLPPLAVREAEGGEASLLHQSVRVVTVTELKKCAGELKGAAGYRFSAFLALRGALEAKDKLALVEAKGRMERVCKAIKQEYAEEVERRSLLPKHEFKAMFALGVGLPPELPIEFRLLDLWPDAHRNPKSLEMASGLLSQAVSEIIKRARLTLWWFAGDFRPAIYCEDVETALFIQTFLIAKTGQIGFRICPHCDEQFFQKRANQGYCSLAHGNAHRVARARNEQKLKSEKSKSKGRSHGTDETR